MEVNGLVPRPQFRTSGNTNFSVDLSNPDFQLIYTEIGSIFKQTPLFAVEVGFSQPSDDLEARVKKLLRTNTVKVVITIDIKETLAYKNAFSK